MLMETPFRYEQRALPEAVVLDLHGDISKEAEYRLLTSRDWSSGPGDGKTALILNFSRVSYINSIGIAVLIRLVRALEQAGCRTLACGLSIHYQKIFRMVGLTEYVLLFPNEFAAIAWLKENAG
jgi:stage II sporulation protein AA (anti-sigma F factor antagonist)